MSKIDVVVVSPSGLSIGKAAMPQAVLSIAMRFLVCEMVFRYAEG